MALKKRSEYTIRDTEGGTVVVVATGIKVQDEFLVFVNEEEGAAAGCAEDVFIIAKRFVRQVWVGAVVDADLPFSDLVEEME